MIYDISQEVFSCAVYPGDPAPQRSQLQSIESGDICNLSAISMCTHNGTHVDAPFHFYADGKTIDQMDLSSFVGPAFVIRQSGELSVSDAEEILHLASKVGAAHRILIAGNAVITENAAKVFTTAGILLVGTESQSVGPMDAPKAVHDILLGAEIVLLEGIRLDGIRQGRYFLCAAPLKLGGCDGAPCRAILIEE